jgi:hypothetical protein
MELTILHFVPTRLGGRGEICNVFGTIMYFFDNHHSIFSWIFSIPYWTMSRIVAAEMWDQLFFHPFEDDASFCYFGFILKILVPGTIEERLYKCWTD